MESFLSDHNEGPLSCIEHKDQIYSELNMTSLQESLSKSRDLDKSQDLDKSRDLDKSENHNSIVVLCSDASGATREVVHHDNKELLYPRLKDTNDIKNVKYVIETQTNLLTRSMSSSV